MNTIQALAHSSSAARIVSVGSHFTSYDICEQTYTLLHCILCFSLPNSIIVCIVTIERSAFLMWHLHVLIGVTPLHVDYRADNIKSYNIVFKLNLFKFLLTAFKMSFLYYSFTVNDLFKCKLVLRRGFNRWLLSYTNLTLAESINLVYLPNFKEFLQFINPHRQEFATPAKLNSTINNY